MEDKMIYTILISAVLLAGAVYTVYSISVVSGNKTNANEVITPPAGEPAGDIFDGTITNAKVTPGTIIGEGIYDRSCNPIGNGLTRCDAGIKTKEYGTLNFNYVHNMQLKPCIAPKDKVRVEILDSAGKAKVQRY